MPTDFATPPGVLAPVFVVLPDAVLPDGTLDTFEVWNQTALGSAPNDSAGNVFHAYVLRPTGTENQFTVVFDSGQLTMPASVNPAGEIASFPAGVAVQAGDVIGFYGQGIPVDVGGGTDILSYPATANLDGVTPEAPGVDQIFTLGGSGFPIYPEARTYSFAAVVTPPGAGAGSGATATATVGANGAVTGLTITDPGSGYAVPPVVTITGSGTGATADAVVQLSGAVTGITVDAAGGAYTQPSITISGGGATTDATAHALGGVDGVTVTTDGNGYKFPTVDFDLPDDPNGTQAHGVAVCADPFPDCNLTNPDATLDVVGVTVTDPGSGYTSAPKVVIRDGTLFDPVNHPGEFTEATGTTTLEIVAVALDTFGTGYTSAPTVAFGDTGAGSGASATATTDFGAVIGLDLTAGGSGYLTAGIRKFVDTLPGLTEAGANNLGQYIPVAQPDTKTFPGTDYYVIAVVQHEEQMHSDLPPTLLREYVQLSTAVVPGEQSLSRRHCSTGRRHRSSCPTAPRRSASTSRTTSDRPSSPRRTARFESSSTTCCRPARTATCSCRPTRR